MKCAYCGCDIDDDSLFCDQCGGEVLICPKCKEPRKGKVCIKDGTPLISAKNSASSAPSHIGQVSVDAVPHSITDELHLINKPLNLDIRITKDVLIGRTMGDFVDIFGKFNTVSRQHLKITFDPQRGWLATDLGSTNHTFYDKVELVPNQPQVLADKSYLQIANIEFFVEIKKTTGKTGTVRL